MDFLRIRGARENNLKNITIDIPTRSFVVITGLSGSGKSSLAFGTIYAEGQRRYVESLSAYARQFLQSTQKPDVDAIEGLMPAIAVDQKTVSKNPRSTVGTVTEIYDYLRLLFARVGVPISPKTGKPITRQTVTDIVEQIMQRYSEKQVRIVCALAVDRKGEFVEDVKRLQAQGFYDYIIDGEECGLDTMPLLNKNQKHTIWVVCDDVEIDVEERERVVEAVENANKFGKGGIIGVMLPDGKQELFSTQFACPETGFSLTELEPRLFSFNNPSGACSGCDGVGVVQAADVRKLIPSEKSSLRMGCVLLSKHPKFDAMIMEMAEVLEINIDMPFISIPQEKRDLFLYGGEAPNTSLVLEALGMMHGTIIEGLLSWVHDIWMKKQSRAKMMMRKYIGKTVCLRCRGARLRYESLQVYICKKNIHHVAQMPIAVLKEWMDNLKLSAQEEKIALMLVKEIQSRCLFLMEIGLGYLSIDRESRTLSGGESQRIRLASQIGSGLTNVLYVLDEPSIGLHPRDTKKLIDSLERLKAMPNTVLVVEHDLDFIRRADHVVDIGPKSGVHGGFVVAQGSAQEIEQSQPSIIGAYLRGEQKILIPQRRSVSEKTPRVTVVGAKKNNLKNITVSFPLGVFVGVSGVSGGGKSSLIKETLFAGLQSFFKGDALPEHCDGVRGAEVLSDALLIDQDPIGRTPRSNPATYCGFWGDIRKIFAASHTARMRGYNVGRFSFNVPGGRCEHCQGGGMIRVEMNFLPDVDVECEACKGRRFNQDTLAVLWKDLSISDVLNLTVDEALPVFDGFPPIKRVLTCLKEVGLGYIALGQSGTTLSGGEAQRIKLAKELGRRSGKGRFYILDEPTTGLHVHDVSMLVGVLQRLVDQGHTVLVIEHNTEMIKTVDWLIDMGPSGGAEGGYVVAEGSPEEVMCSAQSVTGPFLPKS
ncbi:MAG: excinuclease ABC subunit UvrA [Alphaproteobacteria bacterium]|nr:excinuclease ABC subunit UvrA [Alphaproteobacteria bacterium]